MKLDFVADSKMPVERICLSIYIWDSLAFDQRKYGPFGMKFLPVRHVHTTWNVRCLQISPLITSTSAASCIRFLLLQPWLPSDSGAFETICTAASQQAESEPIDSMRSTPWPHVLVFFVVSTVSVRPTAFCLFYGYIVRGYNYQRVTLIRGT
jgi:hypothetical protein